MNLYGFNSSITKVDINIKDIKEMVWNKEKVDIIMMMVFFIKVNGKIIKLMDMVYYIIKRIR